MENIVNPENTESEPITHSDPNPSLTDAEYDVKFKDIKKRQKAFEKAWEIRNFEIKMYWERAKYFWAFIAASFTAYFIIAGSDNLKSNFMELEFIIICIGFIFSLSWVLVNKGSKVWQQNWEGHIDRLEEAFTGPLYRTVLKPKNSYSVTTLNLNVSRFITHIWLLLAIYFLINHNFTIDITNINWWVTLSLFITLYYVIKLWWFSKTKDKRRKSGFRIRPIN